MTSIKINLFLLCLVFCSSSLASFDDKDIERYLGPYKLEQTENDENTSNLCPQALVLMAECTLTQLTLRHLNENDFVFISFEGVNEGEMVTRIKKQIVAKSNTVLHDARLDTTTEKYQKRYHAWYREKTELLFGVDKSMTLQKWKKGAKDSSLVSLYQCRYKLETDAQ